MMAHRKSKTVSHLADNDNLMGNPLKLSRKRPSSDHGKLEAQFHLTKVAGYKTRYPDSPHRNGTPWFDPNEAHSSFPRLRLEDVLKTELGRAYLDRTSQSRLMENGGRAAASPKQNGQRREGSPPRQKSRRTDRRSDQREARREGLAQKNGSAAPKHNQRPTGPTTRLSHRSRSEEESDQEVREVIIGEDYGHSEAPISHWFSAPRLECGTDGDGLSVSLAPAGASGRVSEGSSEGRVTDPGFEAERATKRASDTLTSPSKGAPSPKSRRRSVLRLPGEGKSDAESDPAKRPVADGAARGNAEDHGLTQVAMGGDQGDSAGGGSLSASQPSPGVGETAITPQQSAAGSQDDARLSTPIVLSSDESEADKPSPPRSPSSPSLVCMVEADPQATPPREDASEDTDSQVIPVVLDDSPGDFAPDLGLCSISTPDYSCITMPFYTLHYASYRAEANGDIMINGQRLILPLIDATSLVQMSFSLELRELRRYSVWEKYELEARGLHYDRDEHLHPATLILLLVSDAQAQAVRTFLRELSGKERRDTLSAVQVSPFVLVSLQGPLEGVEMAFLRSCLDIACFNNLTDQKPAVASGVDVLSELEDIHSSAIPIDRSLALIRWSGLDPQLLSLLGQDCRRLQPDSDLDPDPELYPDPELDLDQEQSDSQSESEREADLHVKPTDPQMEPAPKPQTPKRGTESPPVSDGAKLKEENAETSAQESGVEASPLPILRHRRTGESYSVELLLPDSSWTKFKHDSLARRLIQFPPPPSKGRITVTMEDLRCLDSGRYLNDVIIDFYLKYLLQNAPAAVAERSHVFSSFFYKQLTRRDNASEDTTSASSQRQRRHQRVKTWTRHVDIFNKDFLFVPVNQEAHWYLVVICFPGLEEPCLLSRTGLDPQRRRWDGGSSHARVPEEAEEPEKINGAISDAPTTLPPTITTGATSTSDAATEKAPEDSTAEPPPGPLTCTEQTCESDTVCKRPCILIMDSLKLSLHERIFKLLREYLQSEWEVRRSSTRDFSAEQMKSSHCRVPLQDNCTDCGVYLLQYVESFLKDPVLHFELPLRLERWFPRQQVRRKRDEIRDLILYLHRQQTR